MRLPLIAALMVTAAIAPACNRQATAPTEAPAEPAARPVPPAVGAPVVLDPQGVRLLDPQTNNTRLLAFGSPSDEVHDAVAAALTGRASDHGSNPECPPGPLDYSQWEGLTLWFQNGEFVGWAANEPGPVTLTGIGVGATRVQLERDYRVEWVPDSTLGTEFTAGNMSGLIGDAGTITDLWAGVSCNFR